MDIGLIEIYFLAICLPRILLATLERPCLGELKLLQKLYMEKLNLLP